VSGTYALLFFGVLFATGTLHTTASNAVEDVRESQQFQNDHVATIQGTEINITDVTVVDDVNCAVNVTANNTGETRLSAAKTDVLTDGVYEENVAEKSEVDGDGNTDLWLPGQQLEVDVGELTAAPDRVKTVAEPGVADATEVSGLVC
jgi:flagellar protein FlaF